MRSKIFTRVTIIVCALIVAAVVYLLFIRDTTKQAYYCISETFTQESHTGVVCDGEYLYDYDYTTGVRSNKRLVDLSQVESSLNLLSIDSDTEITMVEELPSTYSCSLEAASWYINKLIDTGYEIDTYETDSNHIDYTLSSRDYTIRVVWIKDSFCHIFCLDSGKKYTNPPYING